MKLLKQAVNYDEEKQGYNPLLERQKKFISIVKREAAKIDSTEIAEVFGAGATEATVMLYTLNKISNRETQISDKDWDFVMAEAQKNPLHCSDRKRVKAELEFSDEVKRELLKKAQKLVEGHLR